MRWLYLGSAHLNTPMLFRRLTSSFFRGSKYCFFFGAPSTMVYTLHWTSFTLNANSFFFFFWREYFSPSHLIVSFHSPDNLFSSASISHSRAPMQPYTRWIHPRTKPSMLFENSFVCRPRNRKTWKGISRARQSFYFRMVFLFNKEMDFPHERQAHNQSNEKKMIKNSLFACEHNSFLVFLR